MIRFGTGGWRAIIADGFTRANIRLLCQGLANMVKTDAGGTNGIVIGYDRRFLSREAAEWAAEVLAGNQLAVLLIDEETPTPMIMFTMRERGCDYGMAVTASHNPAIYNGIKLFTRGGQDAGQDVTDRLERFIDAAAGQTVQALPYGTALEAGLIQRINPRNAYIDAIIRQIDMQAIRERGLHIALDPMFGVSKTCLQTILMTARCEVELIHERRDTLFGGRLPSPNVQTLNALRQIVLEGQLDLGIATDGDADRLGIIDDQGQFLHPNQILVLLYEYLLSHKGWRGACVRNVATTHVLDRIAAAYGQRCLEVPVGFKHISAGMREADAIIGGESSGGLTVRGHIPGKDGIYAAALLVEMLAVTGKSLSEAVRSIADRYGSAEMIELDFRFTETKKAEIHERLMVRGELPAFGRPIERVSRQDGCKVYFADGGWVIARFSGTEPLLRIFCEMQDLKTAEDIAGQFAAFLGLTGSICGTR